MSESTEFTGFENQAKPTKLAWLFGWLSPIFSLILFVAALANLAVQSIGEKDIKKVRQIQSNASIYFKDVTILSAILAVIAGLHLFYYAVMYHRWRPAFREVWDYAYQFETGLYKRRQVPFRNLPVVHDVMSCIVGLAGFAIGIVMMVMYTTHKEAKNICQGPGAPARGCKLVSAAIYLQAAAFIGASGAWLLFLVLVFVKTKRMERDVKNAIKDSSSAKRNPDRGARLERYANH